MKSVRTMILLVLTGGVLSSEAYAVEFSAYCHTPGGNISRNSLPGKSCSCTPTKITSKKCQLPNGQLMTLGLGQSCYCRATAISPIGLSVNCLLPTGVNIRMSNANSCTCKVVSVSSAGCQLPNGQTVTVPSANACRCSWI